MQFILSIIIPTNSTNAVQTIFPVFSLLTTFLNNEDTSFSSEIYSRYFYSQIMLVSNRNENTYLLELKIAWFFSSFFVVSHKCILTSNNHQHVLGDPLERRKILFIHVYLSLKLTHRLELNVSSLECAFQDMPDFFSIGLCLISVNSNLDINRCRVVLRRLNVFFDFK